MSKGRKSNYPERPSKARNKGSENIAGKRKGWLDGSTHADVKKIRPSYDLLSKAQCLFGHTNPRLTAFLRKYSLNRVPIHKWGVKGKTFSA